MVKLLLVGLLCLVGCLPPIPFITGGAIDEGGLNVMEAGATTKDSLLKTFGMPAAIMGPGESVYIQQAMVVSEGIGRHARRAIINSDTFFELFNNKNSIGEWHRLYYFFNSTTVEFYWFVPPISHSMSSSRRLWALVNEKTALVDDFVFRED